MLFIAWTFSSFLVLSCLSFANNCSVIKYCFAIYEKAFSFDCACHLLCGKIVVNTTFFGKTNFSFLIYLFFLLNYLFVSFILIQFFSLASSVSSWYQQTLVVRLTGPFCWTVLSNEASTMCWGDLCMSWDIHSSSSSSKVFLGFTFCLHRVSQSAKDT